MELFESFTNILSLLFGGSLISIVTWKFARRKAESEAKKAEAEAKQAEAEAEQEKQNYYQQIVDDIAKDRDYYKTERDELRSRLDSVFEELREIKMKGEEERANLRVTIDTLTKKVESLIPHLCFARNCKNRITSDGKTCTQKTLNKKSNGDKNQ